MQYVIALQMGGDPEKAENYAKELEAADIVAGAKAREIFMPKNADYKKRIFGKQ